MEYKGCTITINRCNEKGWGGYWDFAITKVGESQKLVGRGRGLKREVVSMLKWKIDHNEAFPVVRAS